MYIKESRVRKPSALVGGQNWKPDRNTSVPGSLRQRGWGEAPDTPRPLIGPRAEAPPRAAIRAAGLTRVGAPGTPAGSALYPGEGAQGPNPEHPASPAGPEGEGRACVEPRARQVAGPLAQWAPAQDPVGRGPGAEDSGTAMVGTHSAAVRPEVSVPVTPDS